MSSEWSSIHHPGLQNINYSGLTKSKSTRTTNTLGSLNTGRGVEPSYQQAIKEGTCRNSHWNERNKICVIIYNKYLRCYTHSVSRLLPLDEKSSFSTVKSSEFLQYLWHFRDFKLAFRVICPNNFFGVQAVHAKFQYAPVQYPQGLLK